MYSEIRYSDRSEIRKSYMEMARKKPFLTSYEIIEYGWDNVRNTQRGSERKFHARAADGSILANSIPTRHTNFRESIEDKIYPLVEALTHKKYLTISSCQGHGINWKRYVTICFENPSKRAAFVERVRAVPDIELMEKDHQCNTALYSDGWSVKLTKSGRSDKAKECDYLNYFFMKDSQEWVFLDVIIGRSSEYDWLFKGSPITILKHYLLWIYFIYFKLFLWDKRTKELTEVIDNCIPSYEDLP